MQLIMTLRLIIFDSQCLVCNKFIEWVDNKCDYFIYSSFDEINTINKSLKTNISNKNKIVVFYQGTIYYGGDAIKYILRSIYPTSFMMKFIDFIPNIIVIICYDFFANIRQIFGTKNKCDINYSIKNKLITNRNIEKYYKKLI